jgi:hypothetical protein
MEANLRRSVSAELAEETALGETARSFEEFYQATFRRLLTGLCRLAGANERRDRGDDSTISPRCTQLDRSPKDIRRQRACRSF